MLFTDMQEALLQQRNNEPNTNFKGPHIHRVLLRARNENSV